MGLFIRTELHGATDRDYNVLHLAMERAGFTRSITAGNGITYLLPTGTYHYPGGEEKSTILAKAESAAQQTGRTHGVLVIPSMGATWNGLPEVRSTSNSTRSYLNP